MTDGERLRAILSETLRLPTGEIGGDFDMAGSDAWDSLSHMQLIAGIEDEFGIELDADEIVTMTSIVAIEYVLRGHGIAV